MVKIMIVPKEPKVHFCCSTTTTVKNTAVECANAYNYNNECTMSCNCEVLRLLPLRKRPNNNVCLFTGFYNLNLTAYKAGSDLEIEVLKRQLSYSHKKIGFLEDRVKELELKVDQSKHDVESLDTFKQCLGSGEVIYLIGGSNGSSSLSSLDSFSPSLDMITSLKPMSCARSYAFSVSLEGNILVFGGRNGNSWFDTEWASDVA